jgi:hypothetical protein
MVTLVLQILPVTNDHSSNGTSVNDFDTSFSSAKSQYDMANSDKAPIDSPPKKKAIKSVSFAPDGLLCKIRYIERIDDIVRQVDAPIVFIGHLNCVVTVHRTSPGNRTKRRELSTAFGKGHHGMVFSQK